MKKQLLLAFAMIFASSMAFSQNTTDRHQSAIAIPSNIDRYKIDYELVDESIIASDNSILNSLNLDAIEAVRHETEDIIYLDEISQIEFRVYSFTKAKARKNQGNGQIELKH